MYLFRRERRPRSFRFFLDLNSSLYLTRWFFRENGYMLFPYCEDYFSFPSAVVHSSPPTICSPSWRTHSVVLILDFLVFWRKFSSLLLRL